MALVCMAECRLHAPCALGAYTRTRLLASCRGSTASASTPAACHTPPTDGSTDASRRLWDTSEVSHRSRTASALLACRAFHSASPVRASMPLREARARRLAPRPASHRAVSRPRPLVPPVTSCVLDWPSSALAPRIGSQSTTLPMWCPPWRKRNANSYWLRMSKLRRGRLATTPELARVDSRRSTRCVHQGCLVVSASSAIASNVVQGAAATCRVVDQMLRLPISSRAPPSVRHANDVLMKSPDKLLRTAWHRPDSSRRALPAANADASRELHRRRAPMDRTYACLCGRPAVPKMLTPNH